MKTPRATLYEHNETPGGSIYWEPHIEGILIPVEGTYFDTLDEAIDMYTSYTEMGGFEVKKSGQRKTKSGVVKHKYIMSNKEGIPKGTTRCLFHLLAPIITESGYCNVEELPRVYQNNLSKESKGNEKEEGDINY
ncbi:hypothetical protein Tco_1016111 [Tanacetum coccineum]|uniref:Uncharacterized protein n=1 Tax=Tanacetum coccineum TaxID=301880 RepID=A0ABQ5FMP5_9ASTR